MRYLTIIITALLSLTTWAQTPPTVRTSLAVDTIMLGDQIAMNVEIDKDIATEIMVPEFKDGKYSEKVEIIGAPRIDTLKRDGRSMTLRLGYTITSFDAGIHILGGFPIVYINKGVNDTIQSPETMALVVNTFEIDTTKEQIRDIKQPLGAPLEWAEIKDLVIYGSLGVIALAAIIYLMIRYFKSKRGTRKSRPDEPPHITAIRELEKLNSEKLPQAGRFKEYYSRITDIQREYIDQRYGIWAMEMTTPQIIEAIREVNDPSLVAKLGEIFTLADLVKFAKWTPTIDECDEAYHTAYHYVEETKVIITNPQAAEQDA